MAWENYRWAWRLRGINPTEKLVCLRLANEASESGIIEHLRHQRLANDCLISRVRARHIIYDLMAKGFISEKKPQFRLSKEQTANRYQLNLRCFHPKEDTGPALWRWMRDELVSHQKALKPAVEIHSEESTAYYQPLKHGQTIIDKSTLCVWLCSRPAIKFFDIHKAEMLESGRRYPKKIDVSRLEFIPIV
jgi:hypothetical protein